MYKIKRFSKDEPKSMKDAFDENSGKLALSGAGIGASIAGLGSYDSKVAKRFKDKADKMRILGNVHAAKGNIVEAKTLVKSANLAEGAAESLAKNAKRNKIIGSSLLAASALGYGAKKLHDRKSKEN